MTLSTVTMSYLSHYLHPKSNVRHTENGTTGSRRAREVGGGNIPPAFQVWVRTHNLHWLASHLETSQTKRSRTRPLILHTQSTLGNPIRQRASKQDNATLLHYPLSSMWPENPENTRVPSTWSGPLRSQPRYAHPPYHAPNLPARYILEPGTNARPRLNLGAAPSLAHRLHILLYIERDSGR